MQPAAIPQSMIGERHRLGLDKKDEIPFYGRVGVEEMLMIDRDTKAVRRWVQAGGELEEHWL